MKVIFTALLCLCLGASAIACDVCGCTAGSPAFGTMPQLTKSFIGLRYQYRHYTVFHPSGMLPYSPPPANDYFTAVDLWGRFFVSKRWLVMAQLPFSFYHRVEENDNLQVNGLGDVSLSAGYMVINTGDSMRLPIKQTLQLTGGVKLPTGRNKIPSSETRINPNMMPGSGSVDFVAGLFYSIRYKKFGFATDVSARINTRNPNNYWFGNRFAANGRVFMWLKAKKLSVLPSIGAMYELATNDYNNGSRILESGGTGVWGHLGVELYYKRWGLQVWGNMPLKTNYINGLSKPSTRLNTQLVFTF